jgi:hypothetical protein
MPTPIQKLVYGVGHEVFGAEGMNSPRERLMRFFEEAVELVRSGGLSFTDCHKIIQYEFDRPIEADIRKEIAGAGCTLYAVANVYGESLEWLVGNECKRISQNKEAVRAKHAKKPAEVTHIRRST